MTKFYKIDDLTWTVPDEFISPDIRAAFQTVVAMCPEITHRMPIGIIPTPGNELTMLAEGELIDLLNNPIELANQFKADRALGSWFFNTFIIPRGYNEKTLPVLHKTKKGYTNGVEVITS